MARFARLRRSTNRHGAVGELDAPARITLPYLPPLEARWDNMRISAYLTRALPERFSSDAENLVLTLGQKPDQTIAMADSFQLHARQNEGNLDLALVARDLTVDPAFTNGTTIPPLNGEILVTLDDGITLLGRSGSSLRGHSGTVENLHLKTSEGSAGLSIRGPVSVADNGLVDAQLQVTVDDPQAIALLVSQIFPQRRNEIGGITSGLAGLGSSPTLPVNIRQGRIFVGFLPLGNIPPLR
ncbi:DUF2125 domain-containing protein [Nitratireductor sp. GISD-1A_MAKvit]|uniref:DUF2125 domain-containing protein n=1 Tax=Nitratireductor sp. GISD-1A_MAKvit TaxID=3234198 RepID=UPI0034651EC6